ncbi:glycosyltransferase family 4 protein [Sphingomonas dokdonensis]|uniref:D-inositol-3-phosphate glycosyltransferase n=1 Tax=Sphingomonas dokdonensis TaxID=344880 RepID=A0A245ZNY5_9SPHN|nr:glycosyltransferase [Sphingomonas dokdonensis]OWK31450.1 D-inositol-3-phosphate glycosyltransferase [Sphingomonas dokdonensis]
MEKAAQRRMVVLGGSRAHWGGLESFCTRATEAVNATQTRWTATWETTDTAYLKPRQLPRAARRLSVLPRLAREKVDLVWLQWSAMADLAYVWQARALGLPVMVTPHLGANARLQRVPALWRACAALLTGADRLALLFDGQEAEIALPRHVPQSLLRTFLPPASLAAPLPERHGTTLRLVHAGRLSEGKGTFRTVALCAALRDRGIDVSARIIGRADPQTAAALRIAIDAAALRQSIELIEWVDEHDLIRFLGEADVLAHLSTLDSFPLIVLEAMAMGAMAVVGEMAGARSMVGWHGGYVAQDSSAEDAAAWIAAQSVDALRAQGRAAALSVRAAYGWRSCAEQVIAAADATMATRHRRQERTR